jgi:hypothetical protein
MKTKLLLTCLLSSYFLTAQNLFQESFSSYNSNAQLSGQGVWTNNSSLPGGLGTCVGASCANARVVDQVIGVVAYGSSPKAVYWDGHQYH